VVNSLPVPSAFSAFRLAAARGGNSAPQFSQVTGSFISSSPASCLRRHFGQLRDKASRFFASSNAQVATIACIIFLFLLVKFPAVSAYDFHCAFRAGYQTRRRLIQAGFALLAFGDDENRGGSLGI
jgi:hypothetical protein